MTCARSVNAPFAGKNTSVISGTGTAQHYLHQEKSFRLKRRCPLLELPGYGQSLKRKHKRLLRQSKPRFLFVELGHCAFQTVLSDCFYGSSNFFENFFQNFFFSFFEIAQDMFLHLLFPLRLLKFASWGSGSDADPDADKL